MAGPVVAAAVLLHNYQFKNRIADSKKLTPHQREKAFDEIMSKAYVGIGIMNEGCIDLHNILEASFLAMDNAVLDLVSHIPKNLLNGDIEKKACLLIDGNRFQSRLPYDFRTIIHGDDVSISIACASILAKVTRDRMLNAYDKIFPEYGFKQHKGYPTKKHKAAIKEHGLSVIHRRSFKHV